MPNPTVGVDCNEDCMWIPEQYHMTCRVGTTHRPLGKAPWTYPSGTSRPQRLVGKRYSRVPVYRGPIALPQAVHGAHTTYTSRTPQNPRSRDPQARYSSLYLAFALPTRHPPTHNKRPHCHYRMDPCQRSRTTRAAAPPRNANSGKTLPTTWKE